MQPRSIKRATSLPLLPQLVGVGRMVGASSIPSAGLSWTRYTASQTVAIPADALWWLVAGTSTGGVGATAAGGGGGAGGSSGAFALQQGYGQATVSITISAGVSTVLSVQTYLVTLTAAAASTGGTPGTPGTASGNFAVMRNGASGGLRSGGAPGGGAGAPGWIAAHDGGGGLGQAQGSYSSTGGGGGGGPMAPGGIAYLGTSTQVPLWPSAPWWGDVGGNGTATAGGAGGLGGGGGGGGGFDGSTQWPGGPGGAACAWVAFIR